MKKVRWIVVMMEMESGCHGCARDGKEMVRALAGSRRPGEMAMKGTGFGDRVSL